MATCYSYKYHPISPKNSYKAKADSVFDQSNSYSFTATIPSPQTLKAKLNPVPWSDPMAFPCRPRSSCLRIRGSQPIIVNFMTPGQQRHIPLVIDGRITTIRYMCVKRFRFHVSVAMLIVVLGRVCHPHRSFQICPNGPRQNSFRASKTSLQITQRMPSSVKQQCRTLATIQLVENIFH